jgi:hypothetical protein
LELNESKVIAQSDDQHRQEDVSMEANEALFVVNVLYGFNGFFGLSTGFVQATITKELATEGMEVRKNEPLSKFLLLTNRS